MAISLDINIGLEKKLEEMVANRLKEEMDKEFEEAMIRLDYKKGEIISGILLSVMKTVDIERLGDRITFTIKEIK